MSKKKLIFNADDFGLSKGVNLGIIEAYQKGPVRSATMMAGGAGFDHAVALVKANPKLQVGIHLTLTAGYSLGKGYKTIGTGDGRFLPLLEMEKRAKAGVIDLTEVEAEYELQIQKILSAGIWPTHFDSHHHTHHLPGIFDVFIKMAQKYEISTVRMYDKAMLAAKATSIQTADIFVDGFYGDGVTIENLKALICDTKGKSIEVMLHPAYMDVGLYQASSYNIKRIFELDILTSKELQVFLEKETYQVCSFSDL
ncbi:MAG: chitin disaccharide deacetylase [Lachnospiraceae bacterium]|nr:chitin disaccharide deacetylase [Lachnospiraceae bacterium]